MTEKDDKKIIDLSFKDDTEYTVPPMGEQKELKAETPTRKKDKKKEQQKQQIWESTGSLLCESTLGVSRATDFGSASVLTNPKTNEHNENKIETKQQ